MRDQTLIGVYVCQLCFSANNVHEANAEECFDSGFDLDPRSFEQSPRILRMNPSGNNCESTFILVSLFVLILDHSGYIDVLGTP
jgi:hypothetical protein